MNIRKEYQKKPLSKAKSETKYEQLVSYLKSRLLGTSRLNYPHQFYATLLGCSTRYVRKLFVRLRDDSRFHVSEPKRQAHNRKYFYPLFISLKMSLALLFSLQFLEYESKEYLLYKTGESNVAYGYRIAKMFSHVSTLEYDLLTNRRYFLQRTDRTNIRFLNQLATINYAMPKKEHRMKQPIPDYLLAIQSFKPTEKGYVDLAIVPQLVVGLVDKEMLLITKPPTNPFTYFMAICRRKCNEMGLVFDLDLKRKLMKGREFEDEYPLYDPSYVAPKPQQIPQTGKAKSTSTVKGFVPAGYDQFTQRKQEEAVEKARKRHADLIAEEQSPLEAATRIERALHDEDIKKDILNYWRPKDYNPWLKKLDPIQQRILLGQIHCDCDCPRSFLMIPSKVLEERSLEEVKRDMFPF